VPQREQSTTVAAPAKLNLHLKILAKESSGYHTIETVFHKLALSDEVRITLRPPHQETIHCTVDVGPPEQNLALRAARAFCREAAWKTGFDIHITKRIPAGGGLGGGSADAAATLRALNKLAPTPLPPATLLTIAGSLGADVPFLTSQAVMAIAWNRGDRMLPLDPMPQRHVVLVIPDFGINTAEAYRRFDESTSASMSTPAVIPHSVVSEWESLSSWVQNDFTAIAAAMHPSIQANIDALYEAGATYANLTGSGSVVFGIFDTFPDTNQIARQTQCRVVVTETAAH
jgi:4-diphosphocytidyl-2-C-methyl-D-erythritol kinase